MRRGFTFIEFFVVLTILAILAAIIVPFLGPTQEVYVTVYDIGPVEATGNSDIIYTDEGRFMSTDDMLTAKVLGLKDKQQIFTYRGSSPHRLLATREVPTGRTAPAPAELD